MREDTDCDEFLEFCGQYGEEIATSILEDICSEDNDSRWPYQLIGMRGENRDREGTNRRITGTVHFKARAWMFEVLSGNMNGTEVLEWERCYRAPPRKPPPQSAWMFAAVEAVVVHIKVRNDLPILRSMTARMMRQLNS